MHHMLSAVTLLSLLVIPLPAQEAVSELLGTWTLDRARSAGAATAGPAPANSASAAAPRPTAQSFKNQRRVTPRGFRPRYKCDSQFMAQVLAINPEFKFWLEIYKTNIPSQEAW